MTKYLNFFVCFMLTGMPFFAAAQSGLGLKGGLNLSSVYTDAGSFGGNVSQSLDTRTGWVGGVWARLGNKVYLQPELLASTRGGEVIFTSPFGNPQVVEIKNTYLDVPLLLGFRPVKFIRIMAGPVASVKLREDQRFLEAVKTYASDTDRAFREMSYGYQIGLGLKLLGLELDLRKEGSLSDVSSITFSNQEKFSQRTGGWVFSVGFRIL